VHGDLKTANVLVFKFEGPSYIAKLADFGLSLERTAPKDLGGNPGWLAPEVCHYHEAGEQTPTEDLYKVDIYALGLLIWSVTLRAGAAPPGAGTADRSSLAKADLLLAKKTYRRHYFRVLETAISLLQFEPKDRPNSMEDILKNDSQVYRGWREW
jgi:serine/threonine protein kinase